MSYFTEQLFNTEKFTTFYSKVNGILYENIQLLGITPRNFYSNVNETLNIKHEMKTKQMTAHTITKSNNHVFQVKFMVTLAIN